MAAGRVFKHLPSDLANVWTLKQTMVDRYSCIFTVIHLKSLENNISNVKLTENSGASSTSAILFLRNTWRHVALTNDVAQNPCSNGTWISCFERHGFCCLNTAFDQSKSASNIYAHRYLCKNCHSKFCLLKTRRKLEWGTYNVPTLNVTRISLFTSEFVESPSSQYRVDLGEKVRFDLKRMKG